MAYLNIKWFMQTLFDRIDRTACTPVWRPGTLRRPPDHGYVFNVPWEMKYQSGVRRRCLRDACADLLPETLLHRKKSPYPTYHPGYEKLLVERLSAIVENPGAPVAPLIDRKKAKKFMASHKELGKPWLSSTDGRGPS